MPRLEDITLDRLAKITTGTSHIARAYSPTSHPTAYYINLSMWLTLAKLGVVPRGGKVA